MFVEVIYDRRDDGPIWVELNSGEWNENPHLDPEQVTLFHAPVPESAQKVLESLNDEICGAFGKLFETLFLAGLGTEREFMDEHGEEQVEGPPNLIEKDHLLGREIWQGFKPPKYP